MSVVSSGPYSHRSRAFIVWLAREVTAIWSSLPFSCCIIEVIHEQPVPPGLFCTGSEVDTMSSVWRASTIARAMVEALQTEDIVDRKSTRLNSSHVPISYADFCLNEQNI